MNLISFMRSKIRCLEKILATAIDFNRNAVGSEFEGLERYLNHRSNVFKALELYDRSLIEMSTPEVISELMDGERSEMKLMLSQADRLAEEIRKADAITVDLIQVEQNRIQREAVSSQKNKEVLGRFKSGLPSSSGLDKKL